MPYRSYPHLENEVFWDRLPNGLTLAVVPRPGFTRKLAYFVTDYGAIHQDFLLDGQPVHSPGGVAHYLEHKLFDMPDQDVTEAFASLGASPNAFTSYDMTAYYFSCTENFVPCLELLLKFVSTGYFTSESVEKERGIIGQEIGMNEDSPENRVFENLMEIMYENHPVRIPILGTRESISQITPQVLETCHRAFYRPDNMLLCVVGDVDPAQVRSIALDILPQSPEKPVVPQRSWEETLSCTRHYTAQQMEVAMPLFQLGFKCAPLDRGPEAVRREIIGELAAEALFGESSELYLRLYEQGLIDSSFGGGFETIEGMAMLTASGDSEDPQAVMDAIVAQAALLARDGIPQEAFLRMKRSALGRRIRSLDSFDSLCFRICAYHFSGFDYFRFPEVYTAVEVSEIQDFLRQTVIPSQGALSVILPLEGGAS